MRQRKAGAGVSARTSRPALSSSDDSNSAAQAQATAASPSVKQRANTDPDRCSMPASSSRRLSDVRRACSGHAASGERDHHARTQQCRRQRGAPTSPPASHHTATFSSSTPLARTKEGRAVRTPRDASLHGMHASEYSAHALASRNAEGRGAARQPHRSSMQGQRTLAGRSHRRHSRQQQRAGHDAVRRAWAAHPGGQHRGAPPTSARARTGPRAQSPAMALVACSVPARPVPPTPQQRRHPSAPEAPQHPPQRPP